MNLEKQLREFVFDPYNQEKNFNLGYTYENLGHTAAAITYYVRSAEYGNDDDLTYEALIRVGLCYNKQGSRPVMTRGSFLNAIIFAPHRPEAYYHLSLIWEGLKEYQESYASICQGLSHLDNYKPTRTDIGYDKDYSLIFQKSYISWYTGRHKLSKDLSIELYKSKDTPEFYLSLLKHNLLYFKFSEEQIQEFRNNNQKKIKGSIDIVLQGQYNDYVDEITNHYLQLPFINNIIISCWRGDKTQELSNPRVKYIRSALPSNHGTGNRNLQIVSSLAGLKQVETEFAIKMRNDQKFTLDSMTKMYEFYQENKERLLTFSNNETKPKNRICVSGNFKPFPFHPRDHVFWGNTEDLIDVFNIPLDSNIHDKINIQKHELDQYYDSYIRSESYIGSHYCANFNKKINKWLLNPEKYLYDDSEFYQEAQSLSDELTPKIFKSFPKEGIDLEWPKYGWSTYPYDTQREWFKEYWHEDGL